MVYAGLEPELHAATSDGRGTLCGRRPVIPFEDATRERLLETLALILGDGDFERAACRRCQLARYVPYVGNFLTLEEIGALPSGAIVEAVWPGRVVSGTVTVSRNGDRLLGALALTSSEVVTIRLVRLPDE